MLKRLAYAIRFITVPPIMALGLTTALFFYDPALLGGTMQYLMLLLFLVVLPLFAYALQPLIPFYRRQGREGQRNLAFVMSVIGYVGGILFALGTGAPRMVHIICWTYLISVLLLTVLNRMTPWRASGHACGAAGPVISLLYFLGAKALVVIIIFAAMCWASFRLKRHTPMELLMGSLCSWVAFGLVVLVSMLFV